MTADFADWTIAVIDAGGGGGGYASLTGPGQTAAPGELVQDGDFVVTSDGTDGIQLQTTGGSVFIASKDGVVIETETTDTAGITINEKGTGPVTIETSVFSSTGGINVADNSTTSTDPGIKITTRGSPLILQAGSAGFTGHTQILTGTGDVLGFFGHTGANWQTVSGSKAGNAALASLLTALANLGLIHDTTT